MCYNGKTALCSSLSVWQLSDRSNEALISRELYQLPQHMLLHRAAGCCNANSPQARNSDARAAQAD